MAAKNLLFAAPDCSVVLNRAMVGAVFLSEGLQKFICCCPAKRRPLCQTRAFSS